MRGDLLVRSGGQYPVWRAQEGADATDGGGGGRERQALHQLSATAQAGVGQGILPGAGQALGHQVQGRLYAGAPWPRGVDHRQVHRARWQVGRAHTRQAQRAA